MEYTISGLIKKRGEIAGQHKVALKDEHVVQDFGPHGYLWRLAPDMSNYWRISSGFSMMLLMKQIIWCSMSILMLAISRAEDSRNFSGVKAHAA